MNIVGACCTSSISPLSRINQVSLGDIQKALVGFFARAGMPSRFRVDNGEPFGDPRFKLVPTIALWLIGLGVDVIWNRPGPPKDNPKVERGQRTSKNWGDIFNCPTYTELQQNLDATSDFQRTMFKARRLGYKTRAQAFPDLMKLGRPYTEGCFDINRVYQYLEKCDFARKVSKVGQIRIFGQVYYIDQKRKYRTVDLKFLPRTVQWKVLDGHGNILKIIDAPNFSEDRIKNLTVCQRTKQENKNGINVQKTYLKN